MSIKQMTTVFKDTSLKGNEKLLMLALADNANDSGVSFPSWGNLMEKTSMSRGSVAKWFRILEDKKSLFRISRTRKNGSKTSNKFLIYPYENRPFLDEVDELQFEHLFNQSSEVELPTKVQKLNYQSSEVELPNKGQSSEVELLEPSLITFNHHLLTITNKKMAEQIIEKVSQNSQINVEALSEWLTLKKYKDIAPITKTINFLSKYDFATQQSIVDTSIMNNYKGLFEPKQQKQQQPYNTPKSQVLNTDINIFDEIEKHEALKKGQELIDG